MSAISAIEWIPNGVAKEIPRFQDEDYSDEDGLEMDEMPEDLNDVRSIMI